MHFKDIPHLRLQSQQVTTKGQDSAAEVVKHMGAMQAQDFAMAKWGLGLRVYPSRESEIDKALDEGKILRTHVLRPTWHLLAAEDIHWMLDLSAPQILNLARLRLKQLELTPEVLSLSRKVMEKLLAQQGSCNREELKAELENAGIATNDQRLSYILENAELQKLICSGKSDGRKSTYALLDQRVPERKIYPREEALAKLALRYISSHGPATLRDFTWWSGLNASDARAGLEAVKTQLLCEEISGEQYFFSPALSTDVKKKSTLFLLPAFDEYFVAYSDRKAVITKESYSRAASSNGIFWPIIVQNGLVKGTWKRTVKGAKVIVETRFFELPSRYAEEQAEIQARKLGRFLGKTVDYR